MTLRPIMRQPHSSHLLYIKNYHSLNIFLMKMQLINWLTSGFKNKSKCLWRRTWFCWLPRQKFWRNWWARRINSFIRMSSFWSYGTWSKSKTIVCTPTFLSKRCSCLRGFTGEPAAAGAVHNLIIRIKIWKRIGRPINKRSCDTSYFIMRQ